MKMFRDENGFSTLTIVISLLITLSLIFTSAQVYRVSSASADIQNVADVSAQAAENKVAEFMILVKISDAVILSLSLSGIITTGLGVVAACIPPTAELSTSLLDSANNLFEARDNFADKASKNLNQIQKSLPFIGSVSAYQVAQANNGGTINANYLAVAIMLPGEGKETIPGNINDAKNTLNEINSKSDELKKAAAEAEEAAKCANDARQRAFMADCGNNPNYCMYERAYNKAYMQDLTNPLYNSADTWSFSVALKRTQAYYPKRLQIEAPEGTGVNAQANSALRKVFYSYASKEMQSAYVSENEDFYEANFPHLPRNTEEMKQTSMYSNPIFPISGNTMHAYSGCPNCTDISGYGSIEQMENQHMETCDKCKFKASSLGSVASASTSINNGYEYHYAIVEQASKDYQKAKEEAAPLNKKVKDMAGGFLQKLRDLIKGLANKRIYAKPPGSYGTIAMVVNTGSTPVNSGFESSFVSNSSSLGIRAAISASTLVEEESDEGKTVVNDLFNGMSNNIPGIAGAAGIALDAWSALLTAYSNGQGSITDAVEKTINQIPVMSASGLGKWASKQMKNLMKDLGLEPANLKPLKPVLINSYYVADAAKNEGIYFASKYLSVREAATKVQDQTNQIFGAIASAEELSAILNLKEALNVNGEIEIATIKPLGDWGPTIPLTITLPKFTTSNMNNILDNLIINIQNSLGKVWGGRVWR